MGVRPSGICAAKTSPTAPLRISRETSQDRHRLILIQIHRRRQVVVLIPLIPFQRAQFHVRQLAFHHFLLQRLVRRPHLQDMKAGVVIAAPAHVRAPPVAKVTAKFALFRLSLLDQRGTIRRFAAVLPFIFNVALPSMAAPALPSLPPLSAKQFRHTSPPGVLSRKPSTRVSRFKYVPRTQKLSFSR